MLRLLKVVFGDLALKILAVLIAVFLWFNAVLERNYVVTVRVPLAVHKVETKKIVSGPDIRNVSVEVEGRGKDLVLLRLRPPRFLLDIPEGPVGPNVLELDLDALRLPRNVTALSLRPPSIEVVLHELGTRRVAVEVQTKGRPPEELIVTGIKLLSGVRLVGPREDVRLHATVFTESLDLAGVRQSDTLLLRVLPPEGEGFRTEPESVAVATEVEPRAARIFLGIPVRSKAGDRPATIEPPEAQIAVSGPSSRLDRLEARDIVAQVELSGLEPGTYRLPAAISLPDGFQLVKCEPAVFDVTVR